VPVILIGANTATPYFIAPKLPYDNTILVFRLRVMDNHGAVSIDPAIVYVMVKHNNPNTGPTTSPNANQPQQQPFQSIVPNKVLPTPSQPNVSPSPQIGSFRP
jgi:hypothetical protein